ncbi:MAG: LysM peptidoglycan-binding domain-containing M23 family metallopeptidase, partial [Syntrophomonas sp.]|nr:LysM peptidoglycan-binding domain-containing M23 family metallopeptidase [Syntrophomonas sp.]
NLNALMQKNGMDERTNLEIGTVVKIPVVQRGVHVVIAGDTMYDVAKRYYVSTDALVNANRDKNPKLLMTGDILHIPGSNNIRVAQAIPEPSRGLSVPKLIWPIAGTISSAYGWRKGGFHHGLDIANKIGTPIKAVAEGTVSFSGHKPVYGLTVILDHPDGKQTLYAHAQKTYVKKGQQVKQGEILATVGISGVTTGPHLHFEVRKENKASDPLAYLRR